ncbi:MAG: hypothetical protein JST20_04060 [Bacteroidetes bacterium]|nr:hypothetical protein [Bacteroidota bacterium]
MGLVTLLILSCTSKSLQHKIHFGLNSCFELESGEKEVYADQYSEKYYKTNFESKGLHLAFNKIIRKSDDEYIFICIAIDKNVDEVSLIINSDSTISNKLNLNNGLNIGNVSDYSVTIGSRNNYWLYYFVYFDNQLKQPIVIIHCSKDKDYIINYFSSNINISKRLNCETN